jgi:D-alanyl-D-alanine carboxypeptidase (penicillin-binding protein 5/6)
MTSLRWRRAAFLGVVVLLCVFSSISFAPAAPPTGAAATTTSSSSTGSKTTPVKSPAKAKVTKAPSVQARAAILINLDDGRVLFARNADARRPMASTTKIMTGTVVLETLPLDRKVKASANAAATGESAIELTKGEELTVEQLMEALMIKSANDAAVDLAEASAGSVKAFVGKMNAKAKELGLKNTHFTNPHGLDAKGHYSSARDLATLARYAMANPVFRRLVATKQTTIPWPGRTYDRTLKNHNGLLFTSSYVNGIKTGFTLPAMFCLVASGSKNGVNLVGVLLGEPSIPVRDGDMQALLKWGFSQYKPTVLTNPGTAMTSLQVPYQPDARLRLVTDKSLVKTLYAGDAVETSVTAPANLRLPVSKGAVLGKVRFEVKGRSVGEVDLVADQAIARPSLGVKISYYWDRFVKWVEGVL